MKKRTKGDKAAAHELILFADNESSIYNQRVSIHKNLLRKIKKGQYSDTKAAKLWGYWFEAAAKAYAKQNATPADWSRIFSSSTRRLAARSYASREGKILKAASRGETSDYIYSNPKRRTLWNGRRQMLLNTLARSPEAKHRLSYSDPQYEAKRKTLLLMRKEGLVTLTFNFPHNDDVYYQSTGKLVKKNPTRAGVFARSKEARKEALRNARAATNKEDRARYLALARSHHASVKKHRARRNPSSAYVLIASRKGKKLFFTGKNFSDKGKPKVFATQARAKSKERELLARFPVLETWAVFPVPYRPKM